MTDNRDPISCPSCGTVNPWMNEKCRNCEASLENAAPVSPPEPQTAEKTDESFSKKETARDEPKHSWQPWTWFKSSNSPGTGDSNTRRLNARWILLGLFGYFILFSVGHLLIEKQLIDAHPERQAIYEKMQANIETISDEDREKYLDIFMPVIIAVGFLLVLTPLIMGILIGFYSKGIREGALSMGVAALLIFLLEGGNTAQMAILALFAVAINAGLGAVGALGGRLAREKIRDEG